MLAELENLHAQAVETLEKANTTAVLEDWHRDTLGRRGSIYLLTRQIGQLSAEERPVFGQRLNAAKDELEAAYDAARSTHTGA